MLLSSFSSTSRGKNLDLGGDPKKEKMVMVVAVVVIIAAIAGIVLSLTGGESSDPAKQKTIIKCLDDKCGFTEVITVEEANRRFADIPPEVRATMGTPRYMCSQCQNDKYTAVKGIKCPKCGELVVTEKAISQGKRALRMKAKPWRGDAVCPNCGIEINKWFRENKGKFKKK